MQLQNLRQAEELVELAVSALAAEKPARPISENKVRKAVISLLDYPPKVFHTIEVVDDKIVAFLIGTLEEGIFDDLIYATEIAGYVKPKHRGRVLADKMREEFEAWAGANGANIVDIVTFTVLDKSMRHRGYYSDRSVYYKEVN